MRADVLVLEARDAAVLQACLETLERWAAQRGYPLTTEVALLKRDLASWLGRVEGRVNTTTRPVGAGVAEADDEELIDTEEAGRLLGITEGAVRKACLRGRYVGVARKVRGRWLIPLRDIEAERRAA